jgi:hypothetical protein
MWPRRGQWGVVERPLQKTYWAWVKELLVEDVVWCEVKEGSGGGWGNDPWLPFEGVLLLHHLLFQPP